MISAIKAKNYDQSINIHCARPRSFHGRPGATTSGPTPGVTGGIFLAGLLKRLTRATYQYLGEPLPSRHPWGVLAFAVGKILRDVQGRIEIPRT